MEDTILQIDPGKLRAAREATGLSAREAARKIKIAERNITNYEGGYARPQPHVLAALCRLYKIANALDLFSEVEHPEAFSKRQSDTKKFAAK